MKYRPFASYVGLTLLLALCLVLPALADDDRGEGKLDPSQPQGITVDQIIQNFSAKEKQFKIAREQYTYTQDVTIQTLDGRTVDGQYHQVSDILFDDSGKRIENVVFAPQSSLERVTMTESDFDDIRHRLPFVLTSDDIGKYQILYVGKQKEDELGTYVFDVAPKTMERGERYFQGRIWVDDHDLQIVKVYGETVPQVHNPKHPEKENLSPKYTTWREQIDGKYWFPTYTYAEDTLHFAGGQDVEMRYIVKYKNYKRYGAKSRITYEGQEISKGDAQQPSGTKTPPKQ